MLKKISTQEFTNPAGENCLFASLCEAESSFAAMNYPKGYVCLSIIISASGERMYAWALMKDSKTMLDYLPVFNEPKAMQNTPQSIIVLETGSHFFYDGNCYYVAENDDKKQEIRKVSRFFHQADMEAVFRIGFAHANDDFQLPPFALVKITDAVSPYRTLSAAWLFICNNELQIAPVFAEDEALLQTVNLNELHWQFLDEGDTFFHLRTFYTVCRDDQGKWYLAK